MFAVLGRLRGPLSLFGPLRHVPGWSTRPLYRVLARNRYRILGRRETCVISTPELRARFVDL